MNTTKAEKTSKELLKGTCWTYLNDNFHKFTEHNKIKIALAICTKDIPNDNDHADFMDETLEIFCEAKPRMTKYILN